MGPWRWSVQPGGRRWHRGVVVEVCLEGGGGGGGDPGTGRLCGWPTARWPAGGDPVQGGHG